MSSSRHLPMLMWKSLQKERRSHEAQSLLQQHRHCQPLATSSHSIQGLLPKDTAIIARWAASRFKVQGVCVCVCVPVCVCVCVCAYLCPEPALLGGLMADLLDYVPVLVQAPQEEVPQSVVVT